MSKLDIPALPPGDDFDVDERAAKDGSTPLACERILYPVVYCWSIRGYGKRGHDER
jgi:hypothetical protein